MGKIHDGACIDAFRRPQLLDTPSDPRYDRFARLAATALGTAFSLVSLVGEDGHRFAGTHGFAEPSARSRLLPLAHALCQLVGESGRPLAVADAREHCALRGSVASDALGGVACAGAPLTTSDGRVAGILCVIDRVDRHWSERELRLLDDIAAGAAAEIALAYELATRAGTERASLEELQESRRALTTLLGNLPGAAYRCLNDQAFTIEMVSEGVVEVTGCTASEILSAPRPSFTELIHPDDREAVWEGVQEAIATDRPFQLTYRMIRRDGAVCWVNEQGRAVRDAAGAVVALEGFLADVTERRAAEAALQQGEERYRAFFEQSPLPMWVYDPATLRIQAVNDAAIEQYGYSREEFLAMALTDFRPPEEVPALLEFIGSGLRGASRQFNTRHYRKDGTILHAEISSRELVLDGRRVRLVVANDVTEARVAEQSRRESEERYRQLVELSPDGIVVHQQGRVVFVNRAAATLAGTDDPSALLGRNILEFVHPDCRADVLARMAQVGDGRTISMAEQRWLRLDGAVRDVEVTSMRFLFESEPAVQSVFRDVTERRELEGQLRQSQKMDAVGRLAGGIAHDFNNLLTVIGAHADFLLEDLDSADPRHEDAQQIRIAAGRAAGLTRQLLAFSRKQILAPRPIDLTAAVTDIRPMLERLIGEDVTIEARLAADLGAVMIDGGQIEQVLVNLVVNSRDAMPEGGRILIETFDVRVDESSGDMPLAAREHSAPPGDYVVLAVTDDGAGMPPEVRSRMFDPFFTTKPAGRGTGLGLSTVYGIVRQSGGYIGVSSEVGGGTTIAIHLPRVSETPDHAGAERGLADTPRGTETVLLVEDEVAVRALANRTLARHGYHVLEARDGEEALALATAHAGRIHLVLTDVVMPGMSGRALVERLGDVQPTIAVMYMSGYTDDEILRRGILASPTAFIQKPFSPGDLLRRVRAVLDDARGRVSPS